MKIRFKKLLPSAMVPEYKTDGAAGCDLHLCLPGMGENLAPGQTKLFSTGLSVEIPSGYEIQIRSRSGQALDGLIVTNSPGTIDSDYRGEIKVLLTNITHRGKGLFHGERVAQLVLAKVETITWIDIDEEKLEATSTRRGKKGIGSTNK